MLVIPQSLAKAFTGIKIPVPKDSPVEQLEKEPSGQMANDQPRFIYLENVH